MSNIDKQQAIIFKYLLLGVNTLLVPSLIAMPLLAKEPCSNSLENFSTPNSNIRLGCLKDGLREAILLAQQTGKPLLTQDNLNALIPKDPTSPEFSALATAAKSDLKGFIKSHFSLTPQQEQALNSLSENNIDLIKQAINQTQLDGTPLQIEINQPVQGSSPSTAPSIQIKTESNESTSSESTLSKRQKTKQLKQQQLQNDQPYKGRRFIIFRC